MFPHGCETRWGALRADVERRCVHCVCVCMTSVVQPTCAPAVPTPAVPCRYVGDDVSPDFYGERTHLASSAARQPAACHPQRVWPLLACLLHAALWSVRALVISSRVAIETLSAAQERTTFQFFQSHPPLLPPVPRVICICAGWVFPKYDHVAVGTGTVVNKTAIKQYQQATRDRAKVKTEGGQIIRVEAHPIPGE